MSEVVIPEGFGLATLMVSMTGKINIMTTTIGYAAALTPPEDCANAISGFAVATGSLFDVGTMLAGFQYEGCRVVQNVDGVLMGAEWLEPITGIASGGTPPVNACLLASKNTGLSGRKYRGRSYVPNVWCKETDVDNMGYLNVTAQGYWAGMVSTFYEAFAEGPPLPYLLHSDATAPTFINGMTPKTQMATQRRRMRS